MTARHHTYDPVDDVWAGARVAYAAIRARIAAGGPPWGGSIKHQGNTNMSKLTITCVEFKPMTKNTLRGFCTVDFKELRLKIHEIVLHEKDGRRWCQLPSKPQMRDGQPVLGENGKPAYSVLMTFDTRELSDAFSRAVIEAVLARAPDAFDEAKPEQSYAQRRDEMDDAIPF